MSRDVRDFMSKPEENIFHNEEAMMPSEEDIPTVEYNSHIFDVACANSNENVAKMSTTSSMDCLMNDGVSHIDFVLVYEHESDIHPEAVLRNKRRRIFQSNLEKVGVIIELVDVTEEAGKHLVFVKLHATWNVLCLMAEKLHIRMPLVYKDEKLEMKKNIFNRIRKKVWDWEFEQQQIIDKRRSSLGMRAIKWNFATSLLDIFEVKDKTQFFKSKERHEIMWEVLQSTKTEGSEERKKGIESLLEKGIYVAAFPLHEQGSSMEMLRRNQQNAFLKETLTLNWASWSAFLKPQPLTAICTYFGEKICYYFAFMDFYTKMLLFPTVFGVMAFLFGIYFRVTYVELESMCNETKAPGNYTYCPLCLDCQASLIHHEICEKCRLSSVFDNNGSLVLSCFTTLWAIAFLKLWKRREATLAMKWGTFNLHRETSSIHPHYEKNAKTVRKHPVTLDIVPHIPIYERGYRLAASILTTILILLFDFMCLIIILVCRVALSEAFNKKSTNASEYTEGDHKKLEASRWSIHGIIFLVVILFEKLYHRICHKLTLFECQRTNQKFFNSFIWKLFVFEILNEFVPIWYPSFIKGKTMKTPLILLPISELCEGNCCMAEVSELVTVLLLLRLLVQNLIEIGIPLLKICFTKCKAKEQHKKYQAQWLHDYHLNETQLDGIYNDYMEMMIQFGFIMFFIPAFSLAPLLCFINNIIEIRIDAIKVLRTNRRPVPIRVSGITVWNKFMEIIIKLAILLNACLISFTSDIIPRLYYKYKVSMNRTLEGYTLWSLSTVNATSLNISIAECYYSDFRQSNEPHEHKPEYFQVMQLRLQVFIAYISIFYGLMWLINMIFSDIPKSVFLKNARQKLIVKKNFEENGEIFQERF